MDQRVLCSGMDQQDLILVRLPPLFVDVLAAKPKINPHYKAAKAISEDHVARACGFSPGQAAKLSQTDFAYMAAIVACDAGLDELTLICDWGNWLFLFDDQFDHDHLHNDEHGVREMIELLFDGMSGVERNGEALPPLIQLHNDIWGRLQKASLNVINRYFTRISDYCNGALEQVILQSANTSISFEQGLIWRRKASGVSPLLPLLEFAYGLTIPDDEYNDPNFLIIEQVAVDVVMCHNDIVSYRKEQMEDFAYNLIDLIRGPNGTVEHGMHDIGDFCSQRLRDWSVASKTLFDKAGGKGTPVLALIEGTKCIMMGNLNWSFHTTRYFGSEENRTLARDSLTTYVLAPPKEKTKFPTSKGAEMSDLPGTLPKDTIPENVDLSSAAAFVENALQYAKDVHFTEDALWRDWLALTGRVSTLSSSQNIAASWTSLSRQSSPKNFKAEQDMSMALRLLPGTSWVNVPITFEVNWDGEIPASCSGAVCLVQQEGSWKIWTLTTILESFHGQPNPDNIELPTLASDGLYSGPQHKDLAGKIDSPTGHRYVDVAIIGAGQNGLSLAARLQATGVTCVVLERCATIGDNWTSRYDVLKQHTTKEMNNLPGSARTWNDDDPDLLSAKDVARGYQEYVDKFDLPVLTSTSVDRARYEEGPRPPGTWILEATGELGHITISCRHLALATGGALAIPVKPKIPGEDVFEGLVLHSSDFRNASKWKGQKGLVVGASVSGHDIAQDMFDHELSSVTMLQRSPTAVAPLEWILRFQREYYNSSIPTAVADRLMAGPIKISVEMVAKTTELFAAQDSSFFDALDKVGFLAARPPKANLFEQASVRLGSFYADVGTSKHIASGDIKIASGTSIRRFTPTGVVLEDDREIEADVVVFATGYERDYRVQAAKILGDAMAGQCKEQWGLDECGELRGLCAPVHEKSRLWSLAGAANQARWNSRFIALQIQADMLMNGDK